MSPTLLFENHFGIKPQSVTPITGSGSPRKYYRLSAQGVSAIGVESSDLKENKCFLELDRCLESQGINVPHILATDHTGECYLLQDLGDVSLMKAFDSPQKMELAKKALKELHKIQNIPEEIWAEKTGFKPFDSRLVKWDLNYFKYDFLKPADIPFDEEALEDDFERLERKLLDPDIPQGLMYRDFQSRNIMVHDNKLWFIDFQGARKGPKVYDAVSFIWQAKAPFSNHEREELEQFYAEGDSKILESFKPFKVFRTLQVLGAYGFRGLIQKKSHFIESIPKAVANLLYFKTIGLLDDYPELTRIALTLREKFRPTDLGDETGLTVRVASFSYKKGYPVDPSGNGGGFMFDCRAIHNPGRYEEYKNLTGKDREVIEFLSRTDEASSFVDKAVGIVRPSIERYLQRGFTSLQVGFGCTGGQHRSVFCAETFAKKVKEMYPEIKVELIHKEQQ